MWFRSLYWRIGLGFIALLATLLLVQALLVIWLTGPAGGWLPVRTPARLATVVAAEVSAALAKGSDLPLDRYVREQFARVYQPFFIVMDDGRVIASRQGVPPPPGLIRAARARLHGPGRPFDRLAPPGVPRATDGMLPSAATPPLGGTRPPDSVRETDGTRPPQTERPQREMQAPPGARPLPGTSVPEGTRPADGARGFAGPRSPGEGQGPTADFAMIELAGKPVGVVAVANRGPLLLASLRELGPTLALVGVGLLVVGASVGSLVIFRPARQRMRRLEEAAAAIGSGQTAVRAPELGDDEVTALARAFNRMAAALEASDAARRRLLADVSHELRTPLTAIRGYVETLGMTEVALDEETRQRCLRIVTEETQKLEAIVGDLLDLARLEAGGGTLALQPVPVERLFARIADRHDRALREKAITLITEVGPDAGAVWGNQDRLEQVFQNLAANAVRHTPEGGRIELRAGAAGDQVLVSVRDTGPGIAPDDLPRVFDRFYKADAARTSSHAATGSGLGLSIAKAIIERHGGTIAARNADAGGAVFEVLLNRPAPQANDRPAS